MPQEIDGDVTKHCQILIGMTLTDPRIIFVKGYVEYPVDTVFNPPVASHRMSKCFGTRETQQIVSGLLSNRLAQATFRLHHPNAEHPFSMLLGVQIRQVLGIGNGPIASDLQAAMPFIYRLMKLMLHLRARVRREVMSST